MQAQRTVLLSCAHPDDESFMAGALCRHLTDSGVRVVLSCATLGEEGKAGDPPLFSRDELPAARQRELQAALAILGIADLELLGHHDKKLSAVEPDAIRGQLVRIIRNYKPQVVISFDPNGFNQHPDHMAISRFTSDAISAAADERWYPETGAAHHVQRLVWNGIYTVQEVAEHPALPEAPGVDFLIEAWRYQHAKAAALRAHKTQHISLDRHFFKSGSGDAAFRYEVFRHAWGPALQRRPSSDLFEGLTVAAA